MNIINNTYYDLCENVKVIGIIPITFNKKMDLYNYDLLVIEDDETHELKLVLALNKDKFIEDNAWRANIDV